MLSLEGIYMRKAIFLDRDGTLNYDSKKYVKSVDEFQLFAETPPALKLFSQADYLVIIITNQSGIGRDYFNEEELDKMHAKLREKVESEGGHIDAIYYCPHHPNKNCNCRKPEITNIQKAVKRFDIDTSSSYFIGDSAKDIEAGQKAGCKTVLVKTGIKDYSQESINSWTTQPDYTFDNILVAAKNITK